MTEESNTLAQLFSDCWKDDVLKARFLREPKSVLADYGIAVPEGVTVQVLADTDDCMHITLPRPPAVLADLADDDLAKAAGGGGMANQARQYQRRLLEQSAQ